MRTYIFDLDHTVIDSSHRQLTKADGSLDLAHWIENNTPEKIAADTELPLANHWRKVQRARNYASVIVCTARVIGAADLDWLESRGLLADAILSRPMGDTSGDADLKEKLLRQYARQTGRSWARFASSACIYDDNKNVLSRLDSLGITCYNALSLNTQMVA
jgi:FMN phosphatase YigB (HAD superfamily)